ncbi:MAG: HD domain-containing protein [Spirochaetes bacterium]|nr:HD domain-containing protein [Spirochaetota bacterium]
MSDKLKLLLKVTSQLTLEKDINKNLITLTGLTKTLLNADICSIFLHDEIKRELWSFIAYQTDHTIRIPDDKGIVGFVFQNNEIVNIKDAYSDARFDRITDQKTGYKTKSIVAIPIINSDNKPVGVVEVLNKIDRDFFDQEDIDLLNHMVFYINSIIENTALYKRLKKAQEEIIYKLSTVTRYKDPETQNHIIRVGLFSALLAEKLGLRREEVENIRLAASMHDIGKVGIPDKILLKLTNLSDEEWSIMKTHTTIGYEILKGGDSLLSEIAAIIALDHHEKWDGTGYPNQKKGENISLYGRITAISDCFDALTSDRPYKGAWKYDDVIEELKSKKGIHFDPHLCDIFIKNIDEIIKIKDLHKD